MNWTLLQIAEWIQAKLNGDPDLIINKCVPLGTSCSKGITFIENSRDLEKIDKNPVGAVIVGLDVEVKLTPYLQVSHPRLAFLELLKRAERPLVIEDGIHSSAIIHSTAQIDPTANIGPYVVIGSDSVINSNCTIHPFCYIGDRSILESNVTLFPNVILYKDTFLGEGTIIHSGTVIGADGFGYYWDGKEHIKVPHAGKVEIGEKVEIGANTCIDRAACGVTSIGKGTKLDNLVQVAHNVNLGIVNIMAAQSGIAGSSTTEPGVIIGAQVGVKDHIHLKSGVRLGGQTGVINDLEPGDYFGTPALPLHQVLRMIALEKRLPELFERIKKLEEQLKTIASP